ncbi:GNAT family N-acetyltransferase [Caulobacter sp. 17J65-9]|uniref:GNAT family N-acetyltransferase n=1 Tax=Caulobacter sp. 17J65-9 TaxID=2709382 RepID=UPI0013CAF8E3|nr:GNAT family N-acetyltransferase [Caulobacter sp. 17J65-9]NEX92683.1 GNAT family N-acetyltransferase [Caulobacter sp. 17J65-9]
MVVEIVTDRLRLRRAQPADLDDLFAVLSHPSAMRFWSTPPHADRDQTRAWLHGMVTAPPDASDDFVIELQGRVVGKAGCYRLPDVGYILHPDVWGRGYATEALSAFIPHVFAAHAVDRLTADVDPRNGASLRLLGKMGFVETGRAANTWLVGEEWCDSVYLALERPV